jgi:tetratricopeptide (TPR) repeat protein
MKRILTIVIPVFLISIFANAQPGWEWGDQIDVAKEKNAIYTDMVKAGNFIEAIESHGWLLENTPDLNESLYQNGVKIYQGLAGKESDPTKKAAYQTKTLEMFDLRIEYFGKEAYVMNRKVFPAYKFYKGDKTKYAELYEMYKKAFELNGTKFYPSNIVAYMDVVRRYKLTGGDLSDELVIEIYTELMDLIDEKRKTGKDLAKLDRIADNVDKMLTSTIDLDCDFVERLLGPKLKETGDLKIASKIFKLMLNNKCTDRPLAYDAAKIVNESQPDFAITKFLASKAAKNGEQETAIAFYNQALNLTEDGIKKAEIYMILARMDYTKADKVAARINCRRALAFDPSMKDPHTLIGNMYYASYIECKEGESKTKDRAVFIAAYNSYRRAGDTKNMVKAKAQFPSINDMFSETYEEGTSMQVDCWINETVKLERRPEN